MSENQEDTSKFNVTITTVGYGDKFPVTTEGRIIAAVLMTAGVGLLELLPHMWLPGL